jgi:hypothetical protein
MRSSSRSTYARSQCLRTEGAPTPTRPLSQVDTVPHSETHGFDNAAHSCAAYAQCHELLAGCCNIITQNGGVARELTPTDWHLLSNIVMSHPFHARLLDAALPLGTSVAAALPSAGAC